MGKIAGIVAGVAVPLIISAILCFKFYGSIKKHMKLWGAIGRELDDKMVVPLTSYPQKDAHNNDYDSVGAPAREGGGSHRRDNSKDSLRLEGQVSLPTPHTHQQGLLKERSEQGRGSDTTSARRQRGRSWSPPPPATPGWPSTPPPPATCPGPPLSSRPHDHTEEEVDSSLVISPRALARDSTTTQGLSSMV